MHDSPIHGTVFIITLIVLQGSISGQTQTFTLNLTQDVLDVLNQLKSNLSTMNQSNLSNASNQTNISSNKTMIDPASTTQSLTTSTTTTTATQNMSNLTNATNATASNMSDLTNVTIELPACPLKGCLPCPDNADGLPDCSCLEGYTTSGAPLSQFFARREQLVWDAVDGWLGECLPIDCGILPDIARSRRIDNYTITDRFNVTLKFDKQARFLCDSGYHVDDYDFKDFDGVSGFQDVPLSPEGFEMSRLIAINCSATGKLVSHDEYLCIPVCGDGLLMPVDHLPMYDMREQCDDGNLNSGDGCSKTCRVESSWVCTGGSPTKSDACRLNQVGAETTVVLSVSGRRMPSIVEIGDATIVAMAKALTCPQRDVEIRSVEVVDMGNSSESDPAEGNSSRYHTVRFSTLIRFFVKVSDPSTLSIDVIGGDLRNPTSLNPRLWVSYMDFTSFQDMYVKIINFGAVTIIGDESKGRPEAFSLSNLLETWSIYLSPFWGYLFLIGLIVPAVVWILRIRPRRYKLHGRFNDIPPEFKGNWAYNICTCVEHKWLCCSLCCCLPARLAESWDTIGLMPFWAGVRYSTCCCLLYLSLICAPCGAAMAGNQRSNIRDFFSFGDGKEDNLEFADCCCYMMCPCCCVVQEARHIDHCLIMMPPPQTDPEWMFDLAKEDELEAIEDEEDGVTRRPSTMSQASQRSSVSSKRGA